MATFEMYRKSTLGLCLVDTLDVMVENGTLQPELAIQVLFQFDKSMTEALTHVHNTITFKGHLHTYRFCDNIWTFILHNVQFKCHCDNGKGKYVDEYGDVEQVKIVACNSQILSL